jgi:3-phenylpropionate/trans-cinnamate dioxygenase ferredoxin component
MKFTRAARSSDVREGVILRCDIAGRSVALVKIQGQIYAFSRRCTHEEADLAEGFLDGYIVECPRHGAQFDVRSGEVLSLPATKRLLVFDTACDGEYVHLGIEEGEPTKEREHV